MTKYLKQRTWILCPGNCHSEILGFNSVADAISFAREAQHIDMVFVCANCNQAWKLEDLYVVTTFESYEVKDYNRDDPRPCFLKDEKLIDLLKKEDFG